MGHSLVQNNNFITLQGWMVSELNLKGNELLVFAIIHGFSQDGESQFNGSLQYLANWTNSTKQGVLKNLKSLIEKGYIIKNEIVKGSFKFCTYNTNYKKFTSIKQSLTAIKQSLTNNIVDNIDTLNNSVTYIKGSSTRQFTPPTLEEVENYCKDRNNSVDAKKFFDYYSVNDWCDSKGNKVKNWKQKLITWEKKENSIKKVAENTYDLSRKSKYETEEYADMWKTKYDVEEESD